MPLSQTQLSELEQALNKRELELNDVVDRLRHDLAAPAMGNGPEVRDVGEDGQVRMASTQDITQLDRMEREIDEVSAARRRIREGVYGLCEDCEEEIPYPRLRAVPTARVCLVHEQKRERRGGG